MPIGESLNSRCSLVAQRLRRDTAVGRRRLASQMGGVFGRWAEAVGDAVADHVKPVKLDGTKLVVEVDDPAWATQLRFLETTLKQRLLESPAPRSTRSRPRRSRRFLASEVTEFRG